jgi:hypothetical protein
MKKNLFLPYSLAIFALILGFASCSEDFNSIGTEIVGEQGLDIAVNRDASVVAYSRKLAPFRSNGLGKYQLGVYSDPVFGDAQVSILSQIALNAADPDFGENATVDSVHIYIPYLSTATEVVDEATTYTLDSVYGLAPFHLELFESNYFLRALDPSSDFEENQNYYTDQGSLFDDFLGASLLDLPDFLPSPDEIVLIEGEGEDEVITRLTPGLRASLPNEFFQERIIDMAGSPEFLSNTNFRDYFRGINLKATNASPNGTLLSLNLAAAIIEISYSFDDEDEESGRNNAAFELNFSGIAVNTFTNTLTPTIADDLVNVDRVNGEENLYLRGGAGIMTVIELFGDEDSIGYNDNGLVNQPNGTPDEIDEIRQQGWIINEANLVFHVNQDIMVGGDTEPERIFIYDLKNNRRLRDFDLDPTVNVSPSIDAITTHLGRLERGDDTKGDSYKIRITNYVNDLINRDSTSVKLGLVVAQNVVNPNFLQMRNTQSPGIDFVPEISLQSPEGTVLYGNATPNEEKRLTLEIYYTDPNQ